MRSRFDMQLEQLKLEMTAKTPLQRHPMPF